MGIKNDTRKIWMVPHPTSQYNEDVKMLARQNNLKIYATNIKGFEPNPDLVEKNPPKLTKIGDKKKPGPKKKVETPKQPEE